MEIELTQAIFDPVGMQLGRFMKRVFRLLPAPNFTGELRFATTKV
jgi:hypothetical protein